MKPPLSIPPLGARAVPLPLRDPIGWSCFKTHTLSAQPYLLPPLVLPLKLQPSHPLAFVQIQTHIIEQARAEQVPESSDSLFAYLIERVRNNLHIVLCLSPVGDPFR